MCENSISEENSKRFKMISEYIDIELAAVPGSGGHLD
jgi:hypothetical protein